jgi:hypothetical protein
MSGRPAALGGTGFGIGEQRVVRTGVGRAVLEPADRLDARAQEHVALTGLDGVAGHADALERRRAVPVHGDTGHVDPGEHRGHAGHVVARLAARLPAADDDVFDLCRVERGDPLEDRLDDRCGQVVGPAVDQRPLVRPPDRGPGGGDDDGFGHVGVLSILG